MSSRQGGKAKPLKVRYPASSPPLPPHLQLIRHCRLQRRRRRTSTRTISLSSRRRRPKRPLSKLQRIKVRFLAACRLYLRPTHRSCSFQGYVNRCTNLELDWMLTDRRYDNAGGAPGGGIKKCVPVVLNSLSCSHPRSLDLVLRRSKPTDGSSPSTTPHPPKS